MRDFFKKLLPQSLIDIYRISRAWSATARWGRPSRKLIVIGVTGTDGKTTTCHLIREILMAAGHRTGLLTTVNSIIGGVERVNTTKMTTVNPAVIQRSLAEMVKAGDRYVVIETSSHALDQHRVYGIDYDVAVITNTSHEHLDYHSDMEKYRAAKGKLFAGLAKSYRKSFVGKAAILNQEDQSFETFRRFTADAQIFYGLKSGHLYAREPRYELTGTSFTAMTPVGELKIRTKFVGEVNVYNALAAIAVGLALGLQPRHLIQGLENARLVPGRFELVEAGQDFYVIIDYAVTPKAFAALYSMISRQFLPAGKNIIAVFGATGERDREKRPILGEIAAKYCRYVVLTNEDPFNEDPVKIVRAVADGLIHKGKVEGWDFWLEMDRAQAIKKAIAMAEPGDFVVITGKGAETAMAIGKKRVPWNEREVIVQALEEREKPLGNF